MSYEQLLHEAYQQLAEKAMGHYAQLPTHELPHALAKAEARQTLSDPREDEDTTYASICRVLRTQAVQDVAIIRHLIAQRAELLTERLNQLQTVIADASAQKAQTAQQLETLRPFLP